MSAKYPFMFILTITFSIHFRYPDYVFLNDESIAKSAGMASRYSDSSLHGVVFDIQMLSECDYLVCTFSSQVSMLLDCTSCRAGFLEILLNNELPWFGSVDEESLFGWKSSSSSQFQQREMTRNTLLPINTACDRLGKVRHLDSWVQKVHSPNILSHF